MDEFEVVRFVGGSVENGDAFKKILNELAVHGYEWVDWCAFGDGPGWAVLRRTRALQADEEGNVTRA